MPQDEESITNGRDLFIDHCDRCHDIGKQEIGPSLASVTDKRPLPWLLNFIQSSQGMIQAGDKYAVHLFKHYNNMVMPDFMQLTDEERLDILAYINMESLSKEDYSAVRDSLNYYNSEILGKAEHRYATVQEEEPDYYSENINVKIPNDPPSIDRGRVLFESQCDVCHQLQRRAVGPALASVTDRRPLKWLLDFLDSPTELLEKGDDYANFLVTNYPLIMPDFKMLSQDDKLAILAYIRNESGALTHIAGVNANALTAYDSDTTNLTADQPVTGDMDRVGYDEDGEIDLKEQERNYNTPVMLLMGGVVIMLSLLVWRIFRRG